MRAHRGLLLSSIMFGLFLAPTIASTKPYALEWDDGDYLRRSVLVSRAFWSWDVPEMRRLMMTTRPPVMTLMGIPWGPLTTWEDAGKCLVTHASLTAFLAACCLFLLLRSGMEPLPLAVGCACVFAGLGPFPAGAAAHLHATWFGADALFAWTSLAAVLLIPLEAAAPPSSARAALCRGILWGAVLSFGAITKASFLYFIALVLPVLMTLRARRSGLGSALLSLASLIAVSLPAAAYWLVFGLPALRTGWAASFGHDAPFYFIPFASFTAMTVRDSPGLLLSPVFAAAAIAWLAFRRRKVPWTDIVPLLIIAGYCAVSLSSRNRQIRYSFPGFIALPFLIGLLLSCRTRPAAPARAAASAAAAFLILAAAGVATRHRADKRSIARSEAVLGLAVSSNARRVLLATDSPTLNMSLIDLADAVSPSLPRVERDTLSFNAFNGKALEEDLRRIREADLVVFQDKEALAPPFTNQRVREYERCARRLSGGAPVRAASDVLVYRIR